MEEDGKYHDYEWQPKGYYYRSAPFSQEAFTLVVSDIVHDHLLYLHGNMPAFC